MSVKFVVVGASRTGSTLLVDTLDSLEGICCHGELLRPTQVSGLRDNFLPFRATREERNARAEKLLQERNHDPVKFVNGALSTAYSATGFKAIYQAFLHPDFIQVRASLLSSPDIKFVHLQRQNLLRRYVSQVVAARGGAIHSKAGGNSEIKIKVAIDIKAFKRDTEEVEARRENVSELLKGREVFNVNYEELAADTNAVVADISRFLGVDTDPAAIAPALLKVGSQDLRDVVENYQELLESPLTRNFLIVR